MVEKGGSSGVDDQENDEQEQDPMDGRGKPTARVRKQNDDNRKETSVGNSGDEIEEINHKKLLDEEGESTKAEDSQREITRSESVTKEQSGQSNTSGKKPISIAGSLVVITVKGV